MKQTRYLVTVACTQTVHDKMLTHTEHRTIWLRPDNAERAAQHMAAEFSLRMVKAHTTHTWDEAAKVWNADASTIGPATVVSVEPVKYRKRKAHKGPKARANVTLERYALALAITRGLIPDNSQWGDAIWDVTLGELTDDDCGSRAATFTEKLWDEKAERRGYGRGNGYGQYVPTGRTATLTLRWLDWVPDDPIDESEYPDRTAMVMDSCHV